MKFITFCTFLFVFASCSNEQNNRDSKPLEAPPLVILSQDTLSNVFPVRIGNDHGEIKVVAHRTVTNDILTKSDYVISMYGLPDDSLTRKLDITDLIDKNDFIRFQDSLNSDYTEGAVIKEIKYDFVRSNTLYFDAILQNPKAQKEMIGRFSLYYSPKRKGEISGWFTDEIVDIP